MDKFVLNVPEWQGELLFTKELLVFVGVIILMLTGILFCFWGYKYFRTVLFLGIGTVICYASFLLAESMTGNLVIRMFLTVSLTFLGICIVYFLDIIWGYFLDRLRLKNVFGKNIYLFAAPLGALIIGLTIYWFIWRGTAVAAVPAVVCGLGGLIFQHFRRAKTVRFKCYNDLLRVPRSKTDKNGLEYIAVETAVTAGEVAAVTSLSEYEPESVTVTEAGLESEFEEAGGYEPEPVAVTEAGPESEFEENGGHGPESVSVIEPEPETWSAAECSDADKDMLIGRVEAEPETDLLEDALFVQQMSKYLKNRRQIKQIDIGLAAMAASRHAEAVTAAQREAADVMNKATDAMNKAVEAIDRATASSPKTDMTFGRHQKRLNQQNNRAAKWAAILVAGIGLFVAGRASKGRD